MLDPVDLACRLIAVPSVTPAARRGVRRARTGAHPARFRSPPFHSRRGAPRCGGKYGRAARLRARRISALPAMSTSSRPAKAGTATRSNRASSDGVLSGRGADDMKGAIAAFVAAAAPVAARPAPFSLLITGDEEGPASHGTVAIIDWLERARHQARHDPGRRADQRNPPRRHDQDRPARLGQHVDRGPGHSGPRRLPPPRRQSDRARWPASSPSSTAGGSTRAMTASRRPTSNSPSVTPPGATNLIPGRATRAAQHPLQQSSARRRPGRARPPVVGRHAPGANGRGADLGRGLPDPAGRALRSGGRRRSAPRPGSTRRYRPAAAPRTPASYQAVPGGRFRPAQRDDAQARRKPRWRTSMRWPDLRTDHRERSLRRPSACRVRRCGASRDSRPRPSGGQRRSPAPCRSRSRAARRPARRSRPPRRPLRRRGR